MAQDSTEVRSRSFRDWEHMILPSLEWNYHDGFMLGPVITNSISRIRGLRYHFRPMYAFGSNNISGTANLGYDIYSTNRKALVNRVWINSEFKLYSVDHRFLADGERTEDRYFKAAPEIALFRTSKLNGNTQRSRLSARVVIIKEWFDDFNTQGARFRNDNLKWLQEFRYELKVRDDIAPLSFVAATHTNADFFKVFYRIKKSYIYNVKKHAITLRHSGGFISDPLLDPESFNARLNANGRNGFGRLQNDYTYDQSLLGRSQLRGFWSQQAYDKGAGLRSLGILPTDGKWMIGVGIEADIPVPISPFKISAYVDAAIYPRLLVDGTQSAYSAGLSFAVIPGTLSINIPLLESSFIRDRYELNGRPNFINRISWTFNLKRVNHVVEDYFN